MARQTKTIDVSKLPEALRIAEEVHETNEPRVLRRDSEDLAIVVPIPRRRSRAKAGALAEGDPILEMVGAIRSGSDDVSENKHKYLAEAFDSLDR